VQATKANVMFAIGLTDHNLLTGTFEFVTACKEAGVQPVNGTLDTILFPEVYHRAKSLFNSTKPFLITGIMEMNAEREESFLRGEKVILVG
jgi:DNA polymerase III alpha subunit